MTRRIVIAAVSGSELLDVTGPFDVFTSAAQAQASQQPTAAAPAYLVQLASLSGSTTALRTEGGLRLVPDLALEQLISKRAPAIDTLILAGGSGSRRAARDPAVARLVQRAAARARRVASVCTGAFLLAAAGLLDERRATTHWASCDKLGTRYPRVRVERDPIYVRDGKYWTSAGVTAGIDLALAMVEEDLGREIALLVARWLVVFVRRSGGQAQFSAQLAAQTAERLPLREVQGFILEHPDQPLDVPTLARRAAMSVRHFSRSFRAETGVSPAAYVERVRVETARRLLETSQDGVEGIAARAGFGTPEALRRAFSRRVGLSPREYRARFGLQTWKTEGVAS
jgi:transcriptional regulator GlxA family with amidase domain